MIETFPRQTPYCLSYIPLLEPLVPVTSFSHFRFELQRGGVLACKHQTSGNTPLHVAASGNHGDVTRFLLRRYAQVGACALRQAVNQRNANGQVALQLAAARGEGR